MRRTWWTAALAAIWYFSTDGGAALALTVGASCWLIAAGRQERAAPVARNLSEEYLFQEPDSQWWQDFSRLLRTMQDLRQWHAMQEHHKPASSAQLTPPMLELKANEQ